LLVASALLTVVFEVTGRIADRTAGQFVYCLDDAYIHLAIAKHLVQNHVWGVTSHEFASASSSPLWILLLAADFLVQGVNTAIPLLLNVGSAIAALLLAGVLLRRRGLPTPAILAALAGIAFLTALPTLIIEGMEHTLHIALVVGWIALIEGPLRSEGVTPRRVAALGVLAAFMTVCRFESLFLVFMTCAILFFRGSRRGALIIGAAAWSTVGAFALYSVEHGWHALPNSVLVKAPAHQWKTAHAIGMALGGQCLQQLASNPHVLVLVVAAAAALWALGRDGHRRILEGPRALLVIFLGTTLLHLQFAQTNWFYRYEAYLLAFGILALGLAAADGPLLPVPRWAQAVAMVALAIPLATRSADALSRTVDAAKNIHDQQWQLGRFLRDEMGTRSVASYDIGSVSYLSDVHLVDLGGLGTLETGNVLMRGGFTRPAFDRILRSHDVELVALPLTLFKDLIPKSWRMVGQWKAPGPNRLLMEDVVTFYATGSSAQDLEARLRDFSEHELPADLEWRTF
jgi:hypothetical protein